MLKKIINSFIKIFSITILSLLIGFSLQIALAAWQEPTAAPPGNNIAKPVNIGPDFQFKDGGLLVNNTGLTTVGFIVAAGSVGISTTTPASGLNLAVDGNVGAIKYCDQYGNNCYTTVELYSSGSTLWKSDDGGINIYKTNINGNVGIGTTSPMAKLTVANGSVLFDGASGATPTSGPGTRLMWIPARAAFRAGSVSSNEWDDANIGYGSAAFGEDNNVYGDGSAAFGGHNNVDGNFSAVFGENNIVSGRDSVSFGNDNKVTGDAGAAAFGYQNDVTETSSVAIGFLNNVSGLYSIAFGAINDISGDNSIAGGKYVSAPYDNSFIYGSGVDINNKLTTTQTKQFAVGFNSTTPLFVVNENGVGIGTTTTQWELTVAGQAANVVIGYGTAPGIGRDGDILILDENYNKVIHIEGANSGLPELTNPNSGVYISGKGNSFFTAGNVGIGTTTPNNLLSVYQLIDFNNTYFNTKLGYQAGLNIVSGAQQNTFVGYQAGLSSVAGSTNAAEDNTAVGYQSLSSNTTGFDNSAMGWSALSSNTTGYNNSAVGESALSNNTSGTHNSAVGAHALTDNTTGSTNSALGTNALNSNETGYGNSAVGANSLINNKSGSLNTAMGRYALKDNINGYKNSAVGESALSNNINGYYNTAMGANALKDNNSKHNTAVGVEALFHNINGEYNSALGDNALSFTKNGLKNTAVGYYAGYGIASSSFSNNSLFGYQSGYALTTGSDNTLLGNQAGDNLNSGSKNILLGYQVGNNLTSGIKNIIIGYDIDAPTNNSSNILNIGNLIFATGLNGSGTGLSTDGQVGIGVMPANLTQILEIKSNDSSLAARLRITDTNAGQNPELQLQYGPAGDNDHWGIYNDKGSNNKLQIWSYNNNVNPGNRLTIQQDGNIGIGINDPQQKLEVDGGVRLKTTTAQPTCDVNARGTFWFTQNAGTDVIEICALKANVYDWYPISF